MEHAVPPSWSVHAAPITVAAYVSQTISACGTVSALLAAMLQEVRVVSSTVLKSILIISSYGLRHGLMHRCDI